MSLVYDEQLQKPPLFSPVPYFWVMPTEGFLHDFVEAVPQNSNRRFNSPHCARNIRRIDCRIEPFQFRRGTIAIPWFSKQGFYDVPTTVSLRGSCFAHAGSSCAYAQVSIQPAR